MKKTITVDFETLKCCGCSTALNMRKFGAAAERCACGHETFDLALTVTTVSRDSREAGDAMARVAIGALAGGIGGLRMMASAAGDECTERRTYDLFGMSSRSILELAEQPPEIVVEFVRREAAKANLQSNQGLCAECGEVFTIERAGFTAEGFCSKMCKRRNDAKNPNAVKAPEPAAPKGVTVLNCPKCAKPIKLKTGRVNKCIWCGTTLEGG
jgi:hypothetical protein